MTHITLCKSNELIAVCSDAYDDFCTVAARHSSRDNTKKKNVYLSDTKTGITFLELNI